MTHHENLKILALTGDDGQTQVVLQHLTEKGYPKVTAEGMVSQIEHLSDAGQHRIVTNDIKDFGLYEEIRHDFAGHFVLVGVTSSEQAARFAEQQKDSPENWENLERTHHTELLPLAHHYLVSEQDLLEQIDALVEELGFLV